VVAGGRDDDSTMKERANGDDTLFRAQYAAMAAVRRIECHPHDVQY